MITNQNNKRLYPIIKDRLDEAYARIHETGQWIDNHYSRSVEKKLKQITGRKNARLLVSGTAATMVALLAWGVRNKKVACPNYSYVASANQAALINKVDFFDVDNRALMTLDENFNHDAVIPVSLYGNTIDYDNLKISKHTKLIVDCAQSLGSLYKNKPDGSFGDVAIFSFARNKPVPTAGTAGALVWDDDKFSDMVSAVSNNGKKGRNTSIQNFGLNALPMELQAAQIDIGLDYIDDWQNKRKRIHNFYESEFRKLPVKIIQNPEYNDSNYHKFAMLTADRDRLIKYLAESNIDALAHYTDNFANFFGSDKKFPNTDMFCSEIVTLPNNAWMTDNEIEKVAKKVKDFYV